jgi:aryl carrier-like protein
MAAPPEQRRDLLESLLKEQISRVLGTTPDRLDAARPLTEMGLDSLVAVELKNWTEGELGLQLPSVELLRGPSIAQLIDLLHQQLDPAQAARPAAAAAPTPTVNVDELSDAEVEAMLDSLSPETTPVASS